MDAETHSRVSSGSVEGLFGVLDQKSPSTAAHSGRVALMVQEWVLHMQSRSRCLEISAREAAIAARFHDIGKIGIPDAILEKQGALSAPEWEWMKHHALLGFELFASASSSSSEAALGILHHHERWDGRGYPQGLRGDEIPVLAQVISIADAYDAMTHSRSYQRARSAGAALEEIRLNAGAQFSPLLVEEFAEFLNARRT